MSIGRENVLPLAVSVLLAAGVKQAYADAGPDALRVMTAPTQAIVGALTGIDFAYESGYGYVSLDHRLVLSKSCTGVNYLLAVFGLLAFTVVPAVSGQGRKLLLVGALAGCAYGVTVVVNAVRIAAGVALHEGGYAWGWLSEGRVHRLAGIAVYFVSLLAVNAAGRHALRLAQGGAGVASPIVIAPALAYALVAIAVPLANGALAARPWLFAEHCAWILLVTLPMAAILGTRRRR